MAFFNVTRDSLQRKGLMLIKFNYFISQTNRLTLCHLLLSDGSSESNELLTPVVSPAFESLESVSELVLQNEISEKKKQH
jgi:hypothetical protein